MVSSPTIPPDFFIPTWDAFEDPEFLLEAQFAIKRDIHSAEITY